MAGVSHTRVEMSRFGAASLLVGGAILIASPAATSRPAVTPIKHVIVMYLENNSFDYQLGSLCAQEDMRCDGATTGTISDGRVLPLAKSHDIVPSVSHDSATQLVAVDHGRMDGWDHVRGCGPATGYRCLSEATAKQVGNLWALADAYAISDRTFEDDYSASFGAHIDLVSANLDGFVGDGPDSPPGAGVGCDSHGDVQWRPPHPSANVTVLVPSCIPDKQGRGPYRASPVKYVPTIMDSLDAAGLSWKIYTPLTQDEGYGHAICPTFYECLGSSQSANMVDDSQLSMDLQAKQLPNFSIVIPYKENSEHNGFLLQDGDNWIASVVDDVTHSSAWSSTAIFITWDDCGCLYDHVPPPPGLGIRAPMVIVSPYAKPHFVDHNVAEFASMMAFTEHTFGLAPLPGGRDGGAYDYADSFDFSQRPLAPIAMRQHRVPASEQRYVAAHPPPDDDPT